MPRSPMLHRIHLVRSFQALSRTSLPLADPAVLNAGLDFSAQIVGRQEVAGAAGTAPESSHQRESNTPPERPQQTQPPQQQAQAQQGQGPLPSERYHVLVTDGGGVYSQWQARGPSPPALAAPPAAGGSLRGPAAGPAPTTTARAVVPLHL